MSRRVIFSRTARRQLAEELPEFIAAAAWELIQGDLRKKPQVVGKPLLAPYEGEWSARRGTYRIRYRFDDKTLTVLHIRPDRRPTTRDEVIPGVRGGIAPVFAGRAAVKRRHASAEAVRAEPSQSAVPGGHALPARDCNRSDGQAGDSTGRPSAWADSTSRLS